MNNLTFPKILLIASVAIAIPAMLAVLLLPAAAPWILLADSTVAVQLWIAATKWRSFESEDRSNKIEELREEVAALQKIAALENKPSKPRRK